MIKTDLFTFSSLQTEWPWISVFLSFFPSVFKGATWFSPVKLVKPEAQCSVVMFFQKNSKIWSDFQADFLICFDQKVRVNCLGILVDLKVS